MPVTPEFGVTLGCLIPFVPDPGVLAVSVPDSGNAGPFGEPVDWRAVCGRSARTVRREGRRNSMRRPYPYLCELRESWSADVPSGRVLQTARTVEGGALTSRVLQTLQDLGLQLFCL